MYHFSFTFLTVGSVLLLTTYKGTKYCLCFLFIGQKQIKLFPYKIVLPMVFFARTEVRNHYKIVVHKSQIEVRNGYNMVGHNFLMGFYSIPSSSYFSTPNDPLPIEGKQQGEESGLSQSRRGSVGSGHTLFVQISQQNTHIQAYIRTQKRTRRYTEK